MLRSLEGHETGSTRWRCWRTAAARCPALDDGTLKLWDLESGQLLRTIEGHTERVNAVAVLPDGRRALSGSRDRTLKLWDLESGCCLATFTGDAAITSVAAAGDHLFVAGAANGALHILRLADVTEGTTPDWPVAQHPRGRRFC